MNKVRLSDIAKAAGVSTATVSNALNRKNRLNPEKADEIRNLAIKMGYLSGEEDRRRGIRFVIYRKHGKVVMDTAFFSQLIDGVQEQCRRRSYDLLINRVNAGDDISALTDMPILLLATEMDADDLAPYRKSSSPVLLLDSDFRFESFSSVSIDNCEAGYQAGKLLISKGHKRIGFIDSVLPFNNMKDRFSGLLTALSEADLSCAEHVMVEPTMEGATRDMAQWLRDGGQLPTAFFAGNDIMAIGASMALKQAGYKLPSDVSIVGMDDMPLCLVAEPALTTIRVDKQQLGMIAVDRLIDMIENDEKVYQRIRMSVSTVERQSVLSTGRTHGRERHET